MAALDRIEIRGFKSIRELDLPLRPLNVLIGGNGAGKSNFISVFHLLRELAGERLQVAVARAGGMDTLLHHSSRVTSSMEIKVHFGDSIYLAKLASSPSGRPFFEDERCWHWLSPGQYQTPFELPLGTGHEETRLRAESRRQKGRIAPSVVSGLESFRVYHFHDTSPTAKMKLMGNVDDNDALRADASNLAAMLYLWRETSRQDYDLIIATVRLAAPFFGDFVLEPSPHNQHKIQLQWRERDSDEIFGAWQLSDGTLRFICLVALLLQPALPDAIIVDEPELGLHPAAIHLLAALLKRAATRTQVIVATQSVTLLNQLAPADLVVVERQDGQSTFRRLAADPLAGWLDDYALGELWEKNVFGGRPARDPKPAAKRIRRRPRKS